jgi:hypothetical protein
MTWVRLDDGIGENPKIAAISDSAFALYVTSIAYANRNLTDGFIPRSVGNGQLRYCDGRAAETAAELERTGLWEAKPGGWLIHDYHEYQPSKQAVLELRGKKRRAGHLGGKASAQARASTDAQATASPRVEAVGEAVAQAKSNPIPTPIPIPTPLTKRAKPSATPAGKPAVARTLTKFFVDEWRSHHPKDPMRIGAIGAWARDALKAGWEEERLREVLADAARAKRYRPAQLQEALEKPASNGRAKTFDMLREMHERETNGKA